MQNTATWQHSIVMVICSSQNRTLQKNIVIQLFFKVVIIILCRRAFLGNASRC